MDRHAQKLHSYIHTLEEEKRKIKLFHRELPLCLDLLNNAIENYRQQFSGATRETSTGGPVLKEFIPIKRPCSGSVYNDDETEQDSGHKRSDFNGGLGAAAASDNKRKSDWLRSAQLWNQPHKDDPSPKRAAVLEVKWNDGAFQPFNREKSSTIDNGSIILSSKPSSLSLDKTHSVITSATTSSMAETLAASAVSGRKEDSEPIQAHLKQRLNWSPELHQPFLQDLEQLGGSHFSTPKQIWESIKVDELTNDEVKSQLQKYRLHTRRPGPTAQATALSEDPSKATAVYVSLAAPPLANLDLKQRSGESEGGSHSNRSNLPSNYSLTHTTAASRPE